MRNDPSKAHFEEDAISYNPSSYPQDQEMHSQEVTNLDIIGHFWKSTKTPFFPNAIRPKGLVRGYLKISKKSKNTFKSSKLKKLCIVEVGQF